MGVHIIEDDRHQWVSDTLGEMNISRPMLPSIDCPCPHCGVYVRRALVVSRHDVEMIDDMMTAMQDVCDKYGIGAHMISEIAAQCIIRIAQKAASKQQENKP